MKSMFSTGIGFAAVVSLGMVAFAQTTGQQSTTPQTQTDTQRDSSTSGQQMTIAGCVQREADYRRAQDSGKGGVAGTGIGAGNEFVLTNASISTGGAAGSAAGTSGTAAGTPTGTGGVAGSNAYELTGSNEGQAEKYVGKRVEIMGMLKPAESSASGSPTGGPTAGAPPRGVDITSQDLKLRELEVSSVRETTGTCPQ